MRLLNWVIKRVIKRVMKTFPIVSNCFLFSSFFYTSKNIMRYYTRTAVSSTCYHVKNIITFFLDPFKYIGFRKSNHYKLR